MEQYCQQCSKRIFYIDRKDFFGITSKKDDEKQIYDFVDCTGCGIIQVDSKGKCKTIGCSRNHNRNHNPSK